MKLAVVGSRSVKDYNMIKKHLSDYLENEIEIVTGGSTGVDSLAEQFALEHNIPVKIFLPEWELYGKSAGIKRNELIWQYADEGIAFWDGQSKGTSNSFKLSRKYKKKIKIITIEI